MLLKGLTRPSWYKKKPFILIHLSFFFFIFQLLQALLFAPWPATNEEAMRLAEHLVSCKPNLATVLDNTSPSVQDGSLLATCFGNRSAVLYELGKLEVASSYKS